VATSYCLTCGEIGNFQTCPNQYAENDSLHRVASDELAPDAQARETQKPHAPDDSSRRG